MQKAFQLTAVCCAVLGCSFSAEASVHAWDINELYSNADGTVQFIELHVPDASSGEQFFLSFNTKLTTGTNNYSFDKDLDFSKSTAFGHVLLGTTGFAALGVVTPDYLIADNFLPLGGGTATLSADIFGVFDALTFSTLPTNGTLSMNRNGSVGLNSPTNFAGQTGSVSAVPLPAAFWLFGSGILGLLFTTRR